MAKQTAFVTGLAGFAGSYLAEELLKAGFTVVGTVYNNEPLDNLEAIQSDLKLYPLDLLNEKDCTKLIGSVRPDYIFHLAGQASVSKSFAQVRPTFRANLDGTINLLEAARSLSRLQALLFVSSADAYGSFRPKTLTLTETTPLNPISPYGISKAAAEQVCRFYFKQHRLPAVVVRAFTHSGPRQTDSFVIPSFAHQVARIEAGLQKPVLKVGDLSARRDLSDVRDIVRGYRLAAVKGQPGEVYQLCSGKAVKIQSVVDKLVALASKKITLKVDQARLRKSDIPVLRGDNRLATRKLGYQVRYSLKETVADTLNYWRNRVNRIK